jgi:hypothetical protein
MNSPAKGFESALVVSLPIREIQKDRQAQCRVSLSPEIIRQYAAQIRDGAEFPPVRVWYDGIRYWLSDGFHRLAAFELASRNCVPAEVRAGGLCEAIWDSCGANSTHGQGRSTADLKAVIRRTLDHPNSARLSNRELARHVGLPETTFRRLARGLSAPRGADRLATRNGTQYNINTSAIRQGASARKRHRPKSVKDLQRGLDEMKVNSTGPLLGVLNIFSNWAFGAATNEACRRALEGVISRNAARFGAAKRETNGDET